MAGKSRYQEKLTLIDGLDPYSHRGSEWSADVKLLPSVTYPDIVNYLLFTPSAYTADDLKAYEGLDAYNQFVCGCVRDVVALIRKEKHVVKARVMHSQSLREKPLSPWIVVEKTGEVLAAHCNCKAGLEEACSHIAALLFSVKTSVQIRDSKAATDEKAYWNLPAAYRDAECRPIADIDFSSAKAKRRRLGASISCESSSTLKSSKPPRVRKNRTPSPTPEQMDSFFRDISRCGIMPAILSIVPPYSDSYIPSGSALHGGEKAVWEQ